MWTPALANLTCDFIKTGLYHGHIAAEECSNFFGGKDFSQNSSEHL